MPFAGEERYREILARAEGHEGEAAMVPVAALRAALDEIERLTVEAQEADQKAMRYRLALLDARNWLADLGSTAKADHLKSILLES